MLRIYPANKWSPEELREIARYITTDDFRLLFPNDDKRNFISIWSIVADRIPIEQAEEYKTLMLERFGGEKPYPNGVNSLTCAYCSRQCKSKSGYTLHRKSCDPTNGYPNPVRKFNEKILELEKLNGSS